MINLQLFEEGFTQSELSMFSACGQKWNYRYNQLLQKRGAFSIPLMVGTAAHDTWETFYATKGKRCNVATLVFAEGVIPSLKDIQKLDYWNHVLPAMFRAYAIHYKDDHTKLKIASFEEEISIMYRGLLLKGKIDLTLESGWIVDHKTAARIGMDTVAGWDFRFQFLFYHWLKWKQTGKRPPGYVVNAMKKPELRVKKDESLPAFAQRVFEDMIDRTDTYFYRDECPISKEALEHFEKEILDPKLNKILLLKSSPNESPYKEVIRAIVEDKNTEECQRLGYGICQYIDLCRHGKKMIFQYDTLDRKHQELENQTPEE